MTFKGAAFFDVDGTLLRATIVHYYVFLRTCDMSPLPALLWRLFFLSKVPFYWLTDQWSRSLFNTVFYRNYAGFSFELLRQKAERLYQEFMKPRLLKEAIERIRRHQAQGHAVVLVSGSLEVLLQPLALQLEAARLYAASLEVKEGVCTGRISRGALAGARKPEVIREFAREHEIGLDQCFAYADSLDDRDMLETVGRAAVVNPSPRLRRLALKKGWEVLNWKQSSM